MIPAAAHAQKTAPNQTDQSTHGCYLVGEGDAAMHEDQRTFEPVESTVTRVGVCARTVGGLACVRA